MDTRAPSSSVVSPVGVVSALHVNRPPPNELDYVDEAVATFPKDAQILLAAGSRHELNWRMSLENRAAGSCT